MFEECYFKKESLKKVDIITSKKNNFFIKYFGFPIYENDYLLSYLVPMITSINDDKVVVEDFKPGLFGTSYFTARGIFSNSIAYFHLSYGNMRNELPQITILENEIAKTYNCIFSEKDKIYLEESSPIRGYPYIRARKK